MTNRRRARREKPRAMKRSLAVGSSVARKYGSRKTELASSKDTPCFSRFERALSSSHSKSPKPTEPFPQFKRSWSRRRAPAQPAKEVLNSSARVRKRDQNSTFIGFL